jgi:type IV pilus assembly protein PilW
LSKQYTTSAGNCNASPVDIHIFRARRYFIAVDQETNRPGLYRQVFDINANSPGQAPVEFAERLIDGVENIQILYGEDTTGNDRVADTYVDANSVGDWVNVVSVKLAVLFATVEEDFSAPFDTKNDYQLLDQTIDPTPGANDRRRRKVVEATVSLRNRQLSL